MVKAIIFDCFGVLSTDGWTPFRNEHFADDQSLLDQAEVLNKEMNTGLISYPAFVREISAMAGVSAEALDKQIDSNIPNNELLDFINKELKSKYKIGVLSNSGANWMDVIFSKSHLALFDAVAMSYEFGAVKPDLKAYQVIAEKLSTPIEDCLFIDDQEKHCIGARNAGMHAIKYDNPAQIKKELKKYLRLPDS